MQVRRVAPSHPTHPPASPRPPGRQRRFICTIAPRTAAALNERSLMLPIAAFTYWRDRRRPWKYRGEEGTKTETRARRTKVSDRGL